MFQIVLKCNVNTYMYVDPWFHLATEGLLSNSHIIFHHNSSWCIALKYTVTNAATTYIDAKHSQWLKRLCTYTLDLFYNVFAFFDDSLIAAPKATCDIFVTLRLQWWLRRRRTRTRTATARSASRCPLHESPSFSSFIGRLTKRKDRPCCGPLSISPWKSE